MTPTTLQLRLMAPLLILLAPLMAMQVADEVLEYRDSERKVVAGLQRLVEEATHIETRQVAAARQFMLALADTPEFRTLSPDCQRILDAQKGLNVAYTAIALVDTAGGTRCQIGAAAPERRLDRPWIEAALQGPGFLVRDYTVGPLSGRPTRPMSYTITGPDGRPAGVVVLGIGLGWLDELASVNHLPAGSVVTVFGTDGTIFARYPDDGRAGRTSANADFVRLAANAAAPVTGSGVGLEGEQRVFAIQPLSRSGAAGHTYVGISVPEAMLFADARAKLARVGATAALTALLALAMALYVGRRYLALPLRQVVGAARRLAAGDLGARVGAPAGSGEIGEVARALDDMAATLQRREDELLAAQRLARLGSWRWPAGADRMVWTAELDAIFGVPRDSWVPSPDAMIGRIHPEDRERFRRDFELTLADGAERGVPFRITVDGRVRHCRSVMRGAFGADGRITALFGIVQDVTEHKEASDQLRQAQKMEAVGRLTGGISHDFNNLLQVVLGNTEMLLIDEDWSPPPYVRGMIELTHRAAERGAKLTRRLLAFSRRQELNATRIDVNELVSGMIDMLRRVLGEDVRIATSLADGPWPVRVDGTQLESALLNLATNARDAMPRGGRITIETANVTVREEDAARSGIGPGDYVAVTVTDTGCGMSHEVMAKVFEPFFTTKECGKGSGLGLPMVYGFVHQSGGHVKIHSDVGLGTAVHLYLPRHAEAAEAAPAEERCRPLPHGRETVLIVEDDETVATTVGDRLRRLGYTVLTAADGPEALRTLESGHPVDLLLADMVMPGGMTGSELVAMVRRSRPGIAAIVTSGYSMNAFAADGRLPPDVTFLGKPYALADLAVAVRRCLDGAGADVPVPDATDATV